MEKFDMNKKTLLQGMVDDLNMVKETLLVASATFGHLLETGVDVTSELDQLIRLQNENLQWIADINKQLFAVKYPMPNFNQSLIRKMNQQIK